MAPPTLKRFLDDLYTSCNRREYIHPDPLEFLYGYRDLGDREVVALIASSLAYGRVAQILKSVAVILDRMGPSPFAFLLNASENMLRARYSDFKHRFTKGEELVRMLLGIKVVIEQYGSLRGCFISGFREEDDNVLPALSAFVKGLSFGSDNCRSSLLPSPTRGSACKRLNLFLRWMVRQDGVDPGGWCDVPPSKLIIPLDTHMHRISRLLKLTARKQADMRTALEITKAFASLNPVDPVRYDFALTRLGIRQDMNSEVLNEKGYHCNAKGFLQNPNRTLLVTFIS